MKKIVILMVLAAAAVMYWILTSKQDKATNNIPAVDKQHTQNNIEQGFTQTGSNMQQSNAINSSGQNLQIKQPETDDLAQNDDEYDLEIKPAYQVYSSHEEAFEALKKGAQSYDDIVLEQFASLGDECSWCSQLFDTLKDNLKSADLNQDEKSYYAEVLAISGRLDNTKFLLETLVANPDAKDNEILAEALESVIGGPEVVDYLGKQLANSPESIKESLIAGLTNHGSRQAVETLYNETVARGDQDGYYSLGIGLGEMIPSEESIPFLIEQTKKFDDYSHLAAKALLNSGTEGLKVVMDIVASSNDLDANKKLLTDAIDHVAYEDTTEEYLKNLIATTSNQSVREFADSILKDFQDELDELDNEQ